MAPPMCMLLSLICIRFGLRGSMCQSLFKLALLYAGSGLFTGQEIELCLGRDRLFL